MAFEALSTDIPIEVLFVSSYTTLSNSYKNHSQPFVFVLRGFQLFSSLMCGYSNFYLLPASVDEAKRTLILIDVASIKTPFSLGDTQSIPIQ